MGPTGKGPACFRATGWPATPMPAVSWPAVAGYVILYTVRVLHEWMDISSAAYRTHQQHRAKCRRYILLQHHTHANSPYVNRPLSLALNPEIYTRGERAHSIREMSLAARPCVVHKRATPNAVDESKLGINRRLSTRGARKTTK